MKRYINGKAFKTLRSDLTGLTNFLNITDASFIYLSGQDCFTQSSWTRTFARLFAFCSVNLLFYSAILNFKQFGHIIIVFPVLGFFIVKLSFEILNCRVKQRNCRVKCELSCKHHGLTEIQVRLNGVPLRNYII